MEKSQKWVTEHFEEIVAKYGGKYVAVAEEKVVSSGSNPKEVMEKAKKIVGKKKISLLRVPTEEELICLL